MATLDPSYVGPLDKIPHYLSFDPGKSTGVAYWDDKGVCYRVLEVSFEELIDVFQEITSLIKKQNRAPIGIIYERFQLWKGRNQEGDRLITVQVIGAIKTFAKMNETLIAENKQQDRLIAAKWSGSKVPKGHMPNWQSAYLHGYYYLHKIGVIPPRVLEDK